MHSLLRFVASLLIGTLTLLPCMAQSEWPQWRGPNRDDISTETGLLSNWPEGGPTRSWIFKDCGVGYAGPAIADGKFYLMGGRADRTRLICLDAVNGEELWQSDLSGIYENGWGNGPRSTPTIDGELIYSMTSDGTLTCSQRSDGSKVWSASMTDLGGEVPNWGYTESPLIYQNMLLCTPGGEQGTIAAFAKDTGEILWRSKDISDMAHYSSIVIMQVGERTIGIQILEKQLVGFDLSDGALLWSEPWPGRVAVVPTPIVRDNEVYVSSGYGAGCMLIRVVEDMTIEKLYDNKLMTNHHGGVILLNDHLYGYSDGKGWVCQEFESGDSMWREKGALGKGAIAYADNRFYCVTEDGGEVVLINATTEGWQEQGRFTLDPQTEIRKDKGRIWVHPVICNGRLYLRDQDLVYCYDISSKRVACLEKKN